MKTLLQNIIRGTKKLEEKLADSMVSREEKNLSKLYSSYNVEKISYDSISEKLNIYFKDSNYFKFSLDRENNSCAYLIPTDKRKEEYPYTDNCNGAETTASVGMWTREDDACKIRKEINSYDNYLLRFYSCSAYIDKINDGRNKHNLSYAELVDDFYSRLHSVRSLFNDAQHHYRAGEYTNLPSKEEKILSYPLIESRYIFERFYGFFLGKQEEIKAKLKFE